MTNLSLNPAPCFLVVLGISVSWVVSVPVVWSGNGGVDHADCLLLREFNKIVHVKVLVQSKVPSNGD